MSATIPNFDHNMVLPPHRGNPTQLTDLSPYPCTSLELCKQFGTSPERITILNGFLDFRAQLATHGLINGYQWLDGSFMEDVETREKRAPNDLDLLTIYWSYDIAFQSSLVAQVPEFANNTEAKARFKLDHYAIDAGHSPQLTVEQIRYWLQLFTHNRDGVWKGMLKIDLNTPAEDSEAKAHLEKIVL
ncbi:hypothetical protein QEH52_08790 [Coraliomargarita sp. SDUM461003]|uniref:Uncharacterized protein n=1 Tax=Thalassobacterium maritimum TaxID=3041265 RepID=A0ABU1AVC0_9BACT|nr:hypothetical protein [Coraliomargarita sp. SDUM461003]MDQ8207602.1 hypothetical protein [Coraliomargarita sp. SDUM461003]